MTILSNPSAINNFIPQVPPLSITDPKERKAPVEVVKRTSTGFKAETENQETNKTDKKSEDRKKAQEEALRQALNSAPPPPPESLANKSRTAAREQNFAPPPVQNTPTPNTVIVNVPIEPVGAPVQVQQKPVSDGAGTLARAKVSAPEIVNNFTRISNLDLSPNSQPKTSFTA